MKDSMDTALKKLRLSGLAQTLEVRLQETMLPSHAALRSRLQCRWTDPRLF